MNGAVLGGPPLGWKAYTASRPHSINIKSAPKFGEILERRVQQVVLGLDVVPPLVLRDLEVGVLEGASHQVPGGFHCVGHHDPVNLPVVAAAHKTQSLSSEV